MNILEKYIIRVALISLLLDVIDQFYEWEV